MTTTSDSNLTTDSPTTSTPELGSISVNSLQEREVSRPAHNEEDDDEASVYSTQDATPAETDDDRPSPDDAETPTTDFTTQISNSSDKPSADGGTSAYASGEVPVPNDGERMTPTADSKLDEVAEESSWSATQGVASSTPSVSEAESPYSQVTSAEERTSIDLLSELSHPFKPMVPLQPSRTYSETDSDSSHVLTVPSAISMRPPVPPQLNVHKASAADVAQPELSPISILRSPYDFSPRTIQKPLALEPMPAASSEEATTPIQGAPPHTISTPVSSGQTPMLAQPRPQHAHIPLLSLEMPDFSSPPPPTSSLSHSQSSHEQLQPQRRLSTLTPQHHPTSLQPARLNLSQRRHSSVNVLSPIADSPHGLDSYGYGSTGDAGRDDRDTTQTPGCGQLIPVYHPGLRRFSLMDGGPQVASARLGLARRTSRDSNEHSSSNSVSAHGQVASEENYTNGLGASLAPAVPGTVPIPRIRSIGDLSTIIEPSINEDMPSAAMDHAGAGALEVVHEREGETKEFPTGAAGDITLSLDFDLMSGDGHRMPRPSTQRRSYQRSVSSDADISRSSLPGVAEDGSLLTPSQGQAGDTWTEGVARPRPRPRSHLRPDAERNQLDARRHSVARWSTFEEMGIQSFALAEKKGEKTVDSASRRSVLAKLEAEELKKQQKREEAALKKRGRKSMVLGATIGFGARESSGGKGTMSRPSSSTGSQTATGTNSGAPSLSEASLERDSTSISLRGPPGLGSLLGGEKSRNASMPALGASLARSPSPSINTPPLPDIHVSSAPPENENESWSQSRDGSPALDGIGLPGVQGAKEAAQSTVSLAVEGEKKGRRGKMRKRSPLAAKGEKSSKSDRGCIIM